MEEPKDPCLDCSHKGTRGEPCLTCPKRAAYNAAVEEYNKIAQAIDEAAERTHPILVIKRRRAFEPVEGNEEEVELNEGYEFTVDGAIPEIADGIAKMAIEMDKMPDLGTDAGMGFLTLIAEFYKKLRQGGTN